MKKVGIISFLHNDNFGSSLQAFAIQYTLREWGYDCEHIDYRPNRAEKIRNLLESGNSPKLILEGLQKKKVKADQQGARKKSEAIPLFYQQKMKLSPVCSNRKELRQRCQAYDVLICGSDQIWNPTWLNPAYFLPFSEKRQYKFAYAASLGVSELPAAPKIRKIQRWTAGFDAISVRETEGTDLMEKMTGKKPEVMPDPVCLLTRAEWEAEAGPVPAGSPYLLCYFIGENPAYWETVRRISEEQRLEVRVVPVTGESFAQGYGLMDGLGPDAFLGALIGAEAVCTDSFHCFAFSAIFGKACTVCRRDRDGDPKSRNSRIDSFRREAEREGLEGLREKGRRWLREQLEIKKASDRNA